MIKHHTKTKADRHRDEASHNLPRISKQLKVDKWIILEDF